MQLAAAIGVGSHGGDASRGKMGVGAIFVDNHAASILWVDPGVDGLARLLMGWDRRWSVGGSPVAREILASNLELCIRVGLCQMGGRGLQHMGGGLDNMSRVLGGGRFESVMRKNGVVCRWVGGRVKDGVVFWLGGKVV